MYVEMDSSYDKYNDCYCAPNGYYSLHRDSYELIHALSNPVKMQLYTSLSGYIREMTDCGESVSLSFEDLENIRNSSSIPVSVEEKGARLLQYLYRHSERVGDAVTIHPLNHNFNLTYSPTMQELVYIIEKLREEQLIDREGMTFKLTEKGWSEAAARAAGRKMKPCFVLIAASPDEFADWLDNLMPKLEQCGYLARLINYSGHRREDHPTPQQIAESKLVIAELNADAPELFFDAGYANGKKINVVWTMNHKRVASNQVVQHSQIRPIMWETTDELGAMLQQRLG
ncbi:hypothetical protein [Paenibacillus harenae]|uniref:hypothetical protein n=1 Tax=Paenibacillus harenae TaxID=306543 RepID=UPI0027D8ED31|nr:hypothetical protein [Paenibacillus harenae]